MQAKSNYSDGGGGRSIDKGERLDIDPVINETVPLTKNVLTAIPISAEETEAIINNIKDQFAAGGFGSKSIQLIENIDPCLEKTSSKRFYSGEIAQQNRSNMTEIKENLTKLSQATNDIELDTVLTTIKSYNEHLNNIKKNARRELLEKKAAEFNAKNIDWSGFPKSKSYTFRDGYNINGGPNSPYEDSDFEYMNGDKNSRYEYDKNTPTSDSHEEHTRDPEGNIVQTSHITTMTYNVHKYKQIDCTNGLACIQSPWDPTFEEIEEQFKKVGCPLPYEPSDIVGDESKNNSWGWNGSW